MNLTTQARFWPFRLPMANFCSALLLESTPGWRAGLRLDESPRARTFAQAEIATSTGREPAQTRGERVGSKQKDSKARNQTRSLLVDQPACKEAEHLCHSFTSTNKKQQQKKNLTVKPCCAEAATLMSPGKTSSVTWLHKSAPNETTQQRGVDLITLCTFNIDNILVSLDSGLQVFLSCSRGEFPFNSFLFVLMSGRQKMTTNDLIGSYLFTCMERTLNH